MTITTVPFSALTAPDTINARPSTKDGIDELAASIAAKGLIQPLAVRPADTGAAGNSQRYEIIDGRRRHQALSKLVKARTLQRSTPVAVVIRNEDDAEALETSLMANTVRLPMHPVDQHEVFARLTAAGTSIDDIAARFAITPRTVRQHLALGTMAPTVREAWRKGKIDTATAQAFAAHPNQEVQAAVLAKLRSQVSEWAVRRELSGTRQRAQECPELHFVGEDAYKAAGGMIDDDLFSDERFVTDVPLVEKLAFDKLQVECERLMADGWAWALVSSDFGGEIDEWQCHHVREDDQGDYPEAVPLENYTAEEKARSGCLVAIDYDGTLEIYAGLILPDNAYHGRRQREIEPPADELVHEQPVADQVPSADKADDEIDPFDVSGTLVETVTTARTLAAIEALATDPALAAKVALAALESQAYTTRAHISVRRFQGLQGAGLGAASRAPNEWKFSEILAEHLARSTDEILLRLAHAIAPSLDLVQHRPRHVDEHSEALVATLPAEAFLEAARRHFLAEDYFKRGTKATALAAIGEMQEAGWGEGIAPEDVLADMKKSELATVAAERANACGWLPPRLRHPAYELPPPAAQRLVGKMAAAEQTSEVV